MFPSPLGTFFISIVIPREVPKETPKEFPSPTGIFFISMVKSDSKAPLDAVSVPYGDLFYFYTNNNENVNVTEVKNEFPSPLGFFFISIFLKSNGLKKELLLHSQM